MLSLRIVIVIIVAGKKGEFYGDVFIHGNLHIFNAGLQIDHRLDPANKYLSHSSVESEDMKNIYDGVATLDNKGKAEVELPDWFQALNKDFRYQLTAIGSAGVSLLEKTLSSVEQHQRREKSLRLTINGTICNTSPLGTTFSDKTEKVGITYTCTAAMWPKYY